MTLEEARAACAKQGGFLVVVHSQKITLSGVGDEVVSPGDCISADKLRDHPAPAAPAPLSAPR
jgi:hypothetical protein